MSAPIGAMSNIKPTSASTTNFFEASTSIYLFMFFFASIQVLPLNLRNSLFEASFSMFIYFF